MMTKMREESEPYQEGIDDTDSQEETANGIQRK